MERWVAVTKYEEIANDLKARIDVGDIQPGDRLPTVIQLCDFYKASKVTVRHAIELLAEQGLVTSRRGSGTYVRKSRDLTSEAIASIGRLRTEPGFTAENPHGEVSSDVYAFEVLVPPEDILRYLELEPGDFTYYIERVRRLNGLPISIEYTYTPIDLVPGLKRHHLEGSVYAYIREDLGLHIADSTRTIRAVLPSPMEAERLDIRECDPLLEIEQVNALDTGRPFEYSISHHVGSRFEIRDKG